MSQEREDKIKELSQAIGIDIKKLKTFEKNIGGQYLLDPNEINGLGQLGFTDNTNSLDLGNVGAANLNRNTGGFCFPFDVKIKRLYVWHKNSNADAEA